MSVALRTLLIKAKYFDQLGECNQDFVTPAHYHMPIEVVSVRVREHQHEERTPSEVVSWTERVKRVNERVRGRPKADQKAQWSEVELCMRRRDEDMRRQNRKECEQTFTTEALILSVFWERMVCRWNSERRRLPFC